VPGRIRAVLVKRMLGRKASIAGIALELWASILGLVGGTVLNVLIVAIVGIKETIARVAVWHFGPQS